MGFRSSCLIVMGGMREEATRWNQRIRCLELARAMSSGVGCISKTRGHLCSLSTSPYATARSIASIPWAPRYSLAAHQLRVPLEVMVRLMWHGAAWSSNIAIAASKLNLAWMHEPQVWEVGEQPPPCTVEAWWATGCLSNMDHCCSILNRLWQGAYIGWSTLRMAWSGLIHPR